jgi:hypothetical protein
VSGQVTRQVPIPHPPKRVAARLIVTFYVFYRSFGKSSFLFLFFIFLGLFSLVASTVSLITQLLLYIWLEESDSVRITLTFISLFAVMPLLHLVPRPQGASGNK